MQNYLSIIEQNAFAILIAVTGFFGCLAFSLAGKGLAALYKETVSMTTSNHPFIKQIKLRRENGMRINMSIHNTYAFVLKSMERYKYLNLSVRDYVKTAWLIQLICVMLGLIGGVIKGNIWYTAYGCVCAIAVACVGRIEDVDRREQQIIVNIVDYFDNVLAADKKSSEEVQKELFDIDEEAEKLHSAEKQGADMGETVISEDQRRIIEEVLREYLA